jgi:ABC-type protease/lipase transport system fused ATPase/permease subunit|tara:strand:+ start:16557 stop:16973 length:417 start_codon:yes stop_codon:yes gene_type:complete
MAFKRLWGKASGSTELLPQTIERSGLPDRQVYFGLAQGKYGKPAIPVLDEAKSAFAPATEEDVMKSFDEVDRSCSVSIAAPRLTTVRCCDIIFVLDEFVESDTYDQLVASNDVFRTLLNAGAPASVAVREPSMARVDG